MWQALWPTNLPQDRPSTPLCIAWGKGQPGQSWLWDLRSTCPPHLPGSCCPTLWGQGAVPVGKEALEQDPGDADPGNTGDGVGCWGTWARAVQWGLSSWCLSRVMGLQPRRVAPNWGWQNCGPKTTQPRNTGSELEAFTFHPYKNCYGDGWDSHLTDKTQIRKVKWLITCQLIADK